MDRIIEAKLEPMSTYLVNELPYSTLIKCYDSSPTFRSLAKEALAKVCWPLILSTIKVPVSLLEDFQDILPWGVVVRQQNLSRETIEKFKHHIKWNNSSIYLNTSFRILRHFVDQPNFSWDHFCKYVELPKEYIIENTEKVNWEIICHYQVLDEEILTENIDKLHWRNVSIRQRLSEKFIIDHADHLDWQEICRHQRISINLLRKLPNKINWSSIVCTQFISDEILEEFEHQINWDLLMDVQQLSEQQILKYQYKVNWNKVARNGALSFDFIIRNLHRLDWTDIIRYQCLPYDFIEDHIDYFDWDALSRNCQLPLKFIEDYLAHLDFFLLVVNRSFPVEFLERVLMKDPRFKCDEDIPILWLAISNFDTLNEEFIHKYREELDWEVLCKSLRFEENFIADHHEYIHWPSVCSRQTLSPSFLLQFKKYVCWPIVLVKPHITLDFIRYVTDNYIDMEKVLEYYNTLKALKKLHWTHCSTLSDHNPDSLILLQMGDQLEYFNNEENESNKAYVWKLKQMSTHSFGDMLCSSFKLCAGCLGRNCKWEFCTTFDKYIETYMNYTYNNILVNGNGLSIPFLP